MHNSAHILPSGMLRAAGKIFLLCLCFQHTLISQELDTIRANEHYKNARTLGDAANYEQSIVQYEKARDAYRKASHWLGYVKSLNGLGACHTLLSRHSVAQEHLQLALSVGIDKLTGQAVVADTYQNLGFDWSRQGDYDKQFENYQKALTIRLETLGESHSKVAQTYSSLSVSLKYRGDYDNALIYAKKGLETHLKSLDSNDFGLSQDYTNIGAIYLSKGEYIKAEDYFQRALDVMKNASGEQNQFKAIGFSNLGKSFMAQGHYEKAIAAYENALEVLIQLLGEKHAYAGIFYNNLGAAWLSYGHPSKALVYHKKAKEIFSRVLNDNHPYMAATFINMGKCHAKNGNTSKAVDHFLKGLSIQESVLGPGHPDYAQTCGVIGTFYAERQQWTTAITYFQKGIAGLSPGIDATNPNHNPSMEQIGPKNVVLDLLAKKASAMLSQYHIDKNNIHLKNSLATFQLALDLIDQLKYEITSTVSKQEFIEKSIPIYEKTIEVSHELFRLTGDTDFLKQAFEYSEKSKSFLLLQELRYSQIKKYAGIPDSIINAERTLKIKSVFYEGQLHSALQKKNAEKTKLYREKLLHAQAASEEIKKNIELKYTRYYQLKYGADQFSLDGAQQELLDEGSLLMEFFDGSDKVYLFCITKDDFQIYTIDKNEEYERLIQDFRKTLTNHNLILEGGSELKSTFVEAAFGLYRMILQKPLSKLKQPVHKIIVVPDGKLSYLNFEAFLTALPQNTSDFRFKELDYLIKDYTIGYTYSTAFLKNTAESRKTNGSSNTTLTFGGFAPDYDRNIDRESQLVADQSIAPLPGALKEVDVIAEKFEGKSLLGSMATETAFKETAHKYQILHLAMHGVLDDENPMFSKLFFSKNEAVGEDGFLNAAEIYNLELNADLAVLSACSSGYGNIRKGEGMMSLSRAFAYAGCPSLVASLWQVPDGAAVRPMVNFYDNLEVGLPIDQALRKAKLDYLQHIEDPLFEHPFFWSGFVVHGNTQPLSIGTSKIMVYIYIALIILAVFFVFFWVKKKIPQKAKSI